jgi:hypothetical protein
MRFEFYHPGLDTVPKLSVDGTVSNSLHFSHWEGNETPFELKLQAEGASLERQRPTPLRRRF